MEALLDDGEKCLQCGSHIGIGKAFKHFVNHYVRPSEATRPLLEALYVFRSRLAHGAYSLSIDEPFMGNESFKTIMPTVAHWIAKKGAVSWLLEKTK